MHTFEVSLSVLITFDPSDKFVLSQRARIYKMAKIAFSVTELFKKANFSCCHCSVSTSVSQKPSKIRR